MGSKDLGRGLTRMDADFFFYLRESVLVNRIMNTELGKFHRRDAEDAEFSDYFSALSAPRR